MARTNTSTGGGGGGVESLNALTGAVTLSTGQNMIITETGNDILFSANFTQQGKYMISGGATWSGTGLVYDVSFLNYFFDGLKTANQSQVTLDASDPSNNRIDAIVVDEAGVVSVITGDAAASPVEPPIPEDQLQVQFILVEAGSVTPTIASEEIYMDDPTTNWTFSTYQTATPTGSIDFAGTSSPKQGTECIEASTDARLGARFVRATSFDAYQYTMLQVWVRFTGTAVATNKSLNVRFENSAGTLVGSTVNLFSYGLQRGVLNTWQLVVVPITAFGALPATVKGLKMIMAGGTVGVVRQWDIDYMILTNGSVPYANVPTIAFSKNGTGIASQSGLNLIEGTGVTITGVNNPLYNRVDYTIDASGSLTGTATQVPYFDSLGAVTSDANFTRDNTSQDTIIKTELGGIGLSQIQLNNNAVSILSFDENTLEIGRLRTTPTSASMIYSDNVSITNVVSVSTTGFNVGLDHTTQSAVTFTGSGLNNLSLLVNAFSGTYPTTYTVTVDGLNKDILIVSTSSISGGSFAVGNTITNGLGGSATIDAISTFPSDDKTIFVISSYTGTFSTGNTINNGSGVTATQTANVSTQDTFTWTDGTTTVTQTMILDSNGVIAAFTAPTGHTLTDSWTWTYSYVNQNVLDFSNNDYKFQSTFGTDTFGYQISDNLLGFGLSGSANTYINTGGDLAFTGILNTGGVKIGNTIQLSTGELSEFTITGTGADLSVADALGVETLLTIIPTEFSIVNDNATNQNGIAFNSGGNGLLQLGNLSGGNNTRITIDDVNEHITIGNLPAYDDDAAAGTGGLTAGMVYMTTGSGAAPLNTAGILMIKQ